MQELSLLLFTALHLLRLIPGSTFIYRVSKNGKVVFTAEAKALKSPEQSYRIAISGDMGAGTDTAKKIANEIYKANPDMVAIAGDIVYSRGLSRNTQQNSGLYIIKTMRIHWVRH